MLAGIPVNLVTGRDDAAKSRFIDRLIAMRPAGARWAVLVNAALAGRSPASGNGVYFSEVAEGCICCTAQLPLRVGLTRLLRETEPDRLFIQPSARARTGEIVRMITDRWFAPVLVLRATIHVISRMESQDTPSDEHLAAQVVVIDDEGVAKRGQAAMARRLAAQTNASAVMWLSSGDMDSALLDLPGISPPPRFYPDVPGT